uniref:RING-type E3 ubiquitin transferase n=1 Tax=Davidia involucrata TaxID=16924 RepID=A0A5B7BV82_DAVIN
MAIESRLKESIATIVIAIDKDKNSKFAVKWAVENLLKRNSQAILLHVRTETSQPEDNVPKGGRPPTETELQRFFLPYRGYCARKGVRAKEVVLHDIDVPNALVDYIINNSISSIVVGASSRSALTRAFRNADVPTSLSKTAPDFCSVYVISKSKVQNVRSASRPPTPSSATSSKQTSQTGFSPDTPTSEESNRSFSTGSWRSAGSERMSFDRISDSMQITPRDRFPSGPPSFQSADFSSENLNNSCTSDGSRSSLSSQNPLELEAEMRRLKLELKQTMEMYNSACKEVNTAKQKAREIDLWKTEEACKMQETKQAELAALAMAEMEKQKCKAAIEAAEMAQQVAELESKKRRNAEMKAKHEAEEKKKVMDAFAHNEIWYRKYTIEEIEITTDYFSNSLKIGEGGYGPVYKAFLDQTAVAIKVLRPNMSQGQKQFQREVEVLSCMRHPNMVLLLGACPEYGCLVYEYMENGSLEDRIFQRNNTPPIPWRTRFKIASEIATALIFLHQAKPEPLVHRDLKPANILLDRNYVSKISDVGLARLVPPSVANSVTQYHMTAAAGTFCYIDPEYQQTGMLGVKSDIYSLGVMLLQIITAKPPIGLSHHITRAIERGTFSEMLDPTLTDWPVEEALSFAKLALQCCELRRKDRPDLSSVIVPELNRLRDLGLDYGASNGGGIIYGASIDNPSFQAKSPLSQEARRSNPAMQMETPWTSISEKSGSGSSRLRLENGV